MNILYKKKHELWLTIAFASFASTNSEIASRLYEFSLLAFRHMKWISLEIVEKNSSFDYDRDLQLQESDSLFTQLRFLKADIESLQRLYPNTTLGERLKSDDLYLCSYIDSLLENEQNDISITAFNKARIWPHSTLDQEQTDALTLFLLEESYKEYELILVYNYMQAHTENALHKTIYQDLIDESHYHFKAFGIMLAKLGILTLPRELHPLSYIIKDLNQFVESGIAEEQAAKEMCKSLSQKIKDTELSKFFDYINAQESYHIELMRKLL